MTWQKWHRRLAWLAGLQMLIWLITGLTLNLLPADWLNANKQRNSPAPKAIHQTLADITPLLNHYGNRLLSLETRTHLPFPVYRVQTADGIFWYHSNTLAALSLTSAQIRELAAASYAGNSPLSTPKYLETPPPGIQAQRLYQVDAGYTRIYLDGVSGEVIAHKHPGTDLKQLLLMLHFMDYFPGNGLSFNALPIQFMALATLILALSGIATMIAKGRKGTLSLPSIFNRGQTLELYDNTAKPLASFTSKGSLLNTLNQAQTLLKTQCGGGGNCGMCRLQWLSAPPEPTAADSNALSDEMLAQGIRLGCQHKAGKMQVALVTPAQHKHWQNLSQVHLQKMKAKI